jgi:16S rRNA (guanine527-N7)-methyltransferase
MNEKEVKSILLNELGFSQDALYKLDIFSKEVIEYNKKFNLISKTTVGSIWDRHILDSAQLIKFINFNDGLSLSDLGTGAGFPGIVLAIFNKNTKFHVKLYDKSRVKTKFLQSMCDKLKIKAQIYENDYKNHDIDANFIVSRAFKKLEEHIRISREMIKVSHRLIILKGKSAQEEVKKLNNDFNYSYSLKKSITSPESKIRIIEINK